MKINYPTRRKKRKARIDFHIRNGIKMEGKKDDMRECRDCHKILSVTEFTTHGNRSDGAFYLRSNCRECMSDQNAESWAVKKTAPPKPERCDCCHGKTKKLHLDHVHGTTAFRGWICNNCNTGVGKLGDNLEGLAQAAIYMENDKDKIIKTLHKVFNEIFARTNE